MSTFTASSGQRQAAVVYKMVLVIIMRLFREYGGGKHALDMADKMRVMMVVRINDGAGLPPISVNEISKQLGMSRRSVSRAISEIIRTNGAICKRGNGYASDPNYVASRPDADDYIPEIQDEIARAAKLLAQLRQTRPEGWNILDSLPTAARRARPDGYIDYVNKRWLDYAGVSAEQALGWEWTALIHPDDLPGLRETWLRVLGSERPGEAETRMRRNDGSYGRLVVRAEPMRDDEGAVIAWYGTNVDFPEEGAGGLDA